MSGICVWGTTACRHDTSQEDELLLSDGWEIQSSRELAVSGKELSMPGVLTDTWYTASVPSTVMGVLTEHGLYKDAFKGTNYKDIDKSPFESSWWYRKKFDLPPVRKGQHVSLIFDGVSYAANVWLNGKQIATRNSLYGPFRQFRFDVTDGVHEKNVLAVEVFKAQAGEPNIGFVDWNPRPVDESMGIFREVRIAWNKEVAMTHTAVRSHVNVETLDEAWLTVETQLANQSEEEVEGYLKGELEGKVFTVPVSLQPGEVRTVQVTAEEAEMLHLKHPRLWWCHNLGTPEMYRMHVWFEIKEDVSDSETVHFGVREIKDYFTEEGHRGFLLNGKKVLVRSAGWTDDIFLRNPPERNEIEIQYVRDMNLNAIRFENIWGTSQNIYDLCDKYGLMALVGWSCYWEWESYLGTPCDEYGGIKSEKDMDLIAASLKDQVLWLRNHPSIIAWYVGSDMIPRPELEKRYVSCLSQIDDRPYVASAKGLTSELTGPTGMKMAGPYDYVAPDYWYSEEAPGGAFGFNTETGIGAQLPVKESLQKMIPSDKLWPLNEVWDYHCTTAGEAMHSLDVLKECVSARYGSPKDLDDFLRKADLLNYEGTRAMFEAFRVNIPRTTGVVQWMLNSAWPSLYWQLYDYYLIPTAAYYSVKKSNLPQQLIYNYKENAVFAVNESAHTYRLQARMALYDLNGRMQTQQKEEIEVAPYTVKRIFEVPAVNGNAFLVLSLHRENGSSVADNFYCLSAQKDEHDWNNSIWIRTPLKKPADFTKLSAMAEAGCEVKAEAKPQGDNILMEVSLGNVSDVLAFFIRLSLKDEEEELIYPAFWQDNYLSLVPGERRILQCLIPGKAVHTDDLTLTVAGWNVPEKKISVFLADPK